MFDVEEKSVFDPRHPRLQIYLRHHVRESQENNNKQ